MHLKIPIVTTLLTFVAGAASLSVLSDTRGVRSQSHAFRYLREATAPEITQELVDSYFAGSGFPTAGRTLDQKIQEATAFLDAQVMKTGSIGTGLAVVYDDQVVLAKGFGLRNSSDNTSAVTQDTVFQIGSASKTSIAVGVGLLVEEGKLEWHDPVKQHLPWLKLFDKYAEEHVTVGDLLSMNSGFAREPDLGFYNGQFKTERAFVEALEWSEPEYSLREIPQYASANFEILGQLIEELSGKSWYDFVSERVWKPLGMSHTFASARATPADLQKTALTDGHRVCGGDILGPFSLASSPEFDLVPDGASGLLAAGSIVSSATDMATFARFLLNKGSVGNVKLFNSPATIATMISGKNIATGDLLNAADRYDVHFVADGDTLAAGYGFDYVGDVMWGHAYVMKGGTTWGNAADLSLAPRHGLSVVFLTNTIGTVAQLSLVRSYIMGIFLDVSKDVLDFVFKEKTAALSSPPAPAPAPSLGPSCGILYWKDAPHVTLTPEQSDAFLGTYSSVQSTAFFAKIFITRSPVANEFLVEFGGVNASYFCAGNESTLWYFKASQPVSMVVGGFAAVHDDEDGSFAVVLQNLPFLKE